MWYVGPRNEYLQEDIDMSKVNRALCGDVEVKRCVQRQNIRLYNAEIRQTCCSCWIPLSKEKQDHCHGKAIAQVYIIFYTTEQ